MMVNPVSLKDPIAIAAGLARPVGGHTILHHRMQCQAKNQSANIQNARAQSARVLAGVAAVRIQIKHRVSPAHSAAVVRAVIVRLANRALAISATASGKALVVNALASCAVP